MNEEIILFYKLLSNEVDNKEKTVEDLQTELSDLTKSVVMPIGKLANVFIPCSIWSLHLVTNFIHLFTDVFLPFQFKSV